jgi:hypothetical protein
MLPPILGVISSFFNKEVVSMSSNLNTQTLSSWTDTLPKYMLIFSSREIYRLENHFYFLEFIMHNVMLDLNVLRSFSNIGFL